MGLIVEQVGGVTFVSVPGKSLDSGNSREFKKEVAETLGLHRKLAFDLSAVEFVDSSGLGAIVSCLRTVTSGGGDLKLCGLSRQVRALFELVRMHRVFDILNSRDEVVRAYQA